MKPSLTWKSAIPRLIADFVVVHSSMIVALAISVVYQTAMGDGEQARQLVVEFERYYMRFFWLLSPIFPLTFAGLGFYTHTRTYTKRRKNWAIAQGTLLGVILFLGVNYLIGKTTVGRSVALPFAVLASAGLCTSRMFKNYLENRFELRRRDTSTALDGKPNVLVVGGAGYIGSLLVERLLHSGYKVRVLDALLYGKEPLRSVAGHPDLEVMVGDCRNLRDVVRAVRGTDAIVDLAAIVGDPACEQDREAALEINYGATRMLIEVAKGHGVERLLFASSCSVYGATDVEVVEGSAVHPISLYAETKVNSEDALLTAESGDFHPTVLRFATVFGLGYRPRFDLVVNLLSARAQQDHRITIFNGEQWRPFIHVRDVVEAIVNVLEAPARLVSGEIFNVGDSRLNHTLTNVADIVRQIFPGTEVEHVANTDRRNYRVSFDKIKRRLGFEARYRVEDGVRELKKAFEDQLIHNYKDLRYHNQRFLEVAGVVPNKGQHDASVMAAFSRVA
jgi:nucleoside-diphosphate-sugar epimerase